MFRRPFSGMIHRSLVALALGAWLVGGTWHGAIQVQAAFGDEICTVEGSKRLPGGAPSQPSSYATMGCSLCAASGSPAVATSGVAAALLVPRDARPQSVANGGAFVPALHLSGLASRAPPLA